MNRNKINTSIFDILDTTHIGSYVSTNCHLDALSINQKMRNNQIFGNRLSINPAFDKKAHWNKRYEK